MFFKPVKTEKITASPFLYSPKKIETEEASLSFLRFFGFDDQKLTKQFEKIAKIYNRANSSLFDNKLPQIGRLLLKGEEEGEEDFSSSPFSTMMGGVQLFFVLGMSGDFSSNPDIQRLIEAGRNEQGGDSFRYSPTVTAIYEAVTDPKTGYQDRILKLYLLSEIATENPHAIEALTILWKSSKVVKEQTVDSHFARLFDPLDSLIRDLKIDRIIEKAQTDQNALRVISSLAILGHEKAIETAKTIDLSDYRGKRTATLLGVFTLLANRYKNVSAIQNLNEKEAVESWMQNIRNPMTKEHFLSAVSALTGMVDYNPYAVTALLEVVSYLEHHNDILISVADENTVKLKLDSVDYDKLSKIAETDFDALLALHKLAYKYSYLEALKALQKFPESKVKDHIEKFNENLRWYFSPKSRDLIVKDLHLLLLYAPLSSEDTPIRKILDGIDKILLSIPLQREPSLLPIFLTGLESGIFNSDFSLMAKSFSYDFLDQLEITEEERSEGAFVFEHKRISMLELLLDYNFARSIPYLVHENNRSINRFLGRLDFDFILEESMTLTERNIFPSLAYLVMSDPKAEEYFKQELKKGIHEIESAGFSPEALQSWGYKVEFLSKLFDQTLQEMNDSQEMFIKNDTFVSVKARLEEFMKAILKNTEGPLAHHFAIGILEGEIPGIFDGMNTREKTEFLDTVFTEGDPSSLVGISNLIQRKLPEIRAALESRRNKSTFFGEFGLFGKRGKPKLVN